ncbi:MAG: hypothetical protein M1130_01800 [Actinobacteria bacterium]|nr:hypothetical protein [Actinomycetota bacterium]
MPRKTKKEMIAYITGHETYWLMNSWNGLTGYSRCIKVHRLPLTNEEMDRAFEIIGDENLCEDLWADLRLLIEDFKNETGISVYTNGRSGGYIVMESRLNSHIRDGFPVYSEGDFLEMSYEEVKEIFLTLKRFDRLFDDMVSALKYYCSLEIAEESYTVVKKRKVFKEKDYPEGGEPANPSLFATVLAGSE